MKQFYSKLLGFVIIFGIFGLLGIFLFSRLGLSLHHVDRIVTVKGLAEREVLADIGILEIKFMNWGENLKKIGASSKESIKQISDYLRAKGFTSKEIEIGNFNLYRDIQRVENFALYQAEFQRVNRQSVSKGPRVKDDNPTLLIYQGNIIVKTNSVLKLRNLEREIYELITKGVMITSHQARYIYTKVQNIKPVLLEEAIKNARQSALVFTRNSILKLGNIQQADQGVMVILPTDYSSHSNTNLYREPQVPKKIVRIVVTVKYAIQSWI